MVWTWVLLRMAVSPKMVVFLKTSQHGIQVPFGATLFVKWLKVISRTSHMSGPGLRQLFPYTFARNELRGQQRQQDWLAIG